MKMQNLRLQDVRSTRGPGIAKVPLWPNLLELFRSDLFERYAMGWARCHLPLDRGPFSKAETELRKYIRTFRSEALWLEASTSIVRHLRLKIRQAIREHLPVDAHELAEHALATETFQAILPA